MECREGRKQAGANEGGVAAFDRAALQAHYERMGREGGYVAKCKMWLPEDLAGKRVLDVGCRRGKGAYEISECVGADGFVVGTEWNEVFIERAWEGLSRALERSGLAESNVEFVRAFPEDVAEATAAFGPFDVAIANSVMNVAYDRTAAYGAIVHALKPGGLFYYATVAAEADATDEALARAYAAGDTISAALREETVLVELRAAGFASCEVVSREAIMGEGAAPSVRAIVIAARTAA